MTRTTTKSYLSSSTDTLGEEVFQEVDMVSIIVVGVLFVVILMICIILACRSKSADLDHVNGKMLTHICVCFNIYIYDDTGSLW